MVKYIKEIYKVIIPHKVRKSLLINQLKNKLLGHNWIYNSDYYDCNVKNPAFQSANSIADSIYNEFRVQSIIDVGCGTGAVLEALRDRGCEVFGLEYSNAALKYCRSRGLEVAKFDLEKDVYQSNRTFDVAVSMEVAEHLPEKAADSYIKLLTSLSKTIVFTAAPPGQGGTDHVNEQPPSYWISKFSQQGFEYEIKLSEKWSEKWKAEGIVASWYYQNLMIFIKK